MRVITLAGSPRFPSRSSSLLEYAREKLNGLDVEVYHWNLQNFAPEDLLYARFDSPALKTFTEQLQQADGLIVATPVYKAAYSGALKTLLDLLPERALQGKVVLPLATGGTVAHLLAVDYALKPVLSALKAQEILHGVFADDSQVIDYHHRPQFTPNLQTRLDTALETFWQAAERLISHLDDETIAKAQAAFARTDSVGQQRMAALHNGKRDNLEISPNLWAGVGLVRGGAGTALVGDGPTVAARINEYAALGIDSFVLSGYPHLEEAYRVGELLFPHLDVAIPEIPQPQPLNPQGEAVANDFIPRKVAQS